MSLQYRGISPYVTTVEFSVPVSVAEGSTERLTVFVTPFRTLAYRKFRPFLRLTGFPLESRSKDSVAEPLSNRKSPASVSASLGAKPTSCFRVSALGRVEYSSAPEPFTVTTLWEAAA